MTGKLVKRCDGSIFISLGYLGRCLKIEYKNKTAVSKIDGLIRLVPADKKYAPIVMFVL